MVICKEIARPLLDFRVDLPSEPLLITVYDPYMRLSAPFCEGSATLGPAAPFGSVERFCSTSVRTVYALSTTM